jgi:hypothetical protein
MFGIIGGARRRARLRRRPALTHVSAPSSEKDTRMNWLIKVFYIVTGGRPMKRECSAFYDPIANEPVYFFRDRLNNVRYMATHKWSRFRVEAENQN